MAFIGDRRLVALLKISTTLYFHEISHKNYTATKVKKQLFKVDKLNRVFKNLYGITNDSLRTIMKITNLYSPHHPNALTHYEI